MERAVQNRKPQKQSSVEPSGLLSSRPAGDGQPSLFVAPASGHSLKGIDLTAHSPARQSILQKKAGRLLARLTKQEGRDSSGDSAPELPAPASPAEESAPANRALSGTPLSASTAAGVRRDSINSKQAPLQRRSSASTAPSTPDTTSYITPPRAEAPAPSPALEADLSTETDSAAGSSEREAPPVSKARVSAGAGGASPSNPPPADAPVRQRTEQSIVQLARFAARHAASIDGVVASPAIGYRHSFTKMMTARPKPAILQRLAEGATGVGAATVADAAPFDGAEPVAVPDNVAQRAGDAGSVTGAGSAAAAASGAPAAAAGANKPAASTATTAYDRGRLTYDAEGGGAKPYQPTKESGVTIGHGYDMKDRTAEQAKADLVAAGVEAKRAADIAKGAGKTGTDAANFAASNGGLTLTEAQQQKLYEATYPTYETKAKSIYDNNSTNQFDQLPAAAKSVATDLIYHGATKSAAAGTMAKDNSDIFQLLMKNDLKGARDKANEIYERRKKDKAEASDRYQRRVEELDKAIADQKANTASAASPAPAATTPPAQPAAPPPAPGGPH